MYMKREMGRGQSVSYVFQECGESWVLWARHRLEHADVAAVFEAHQLVHATQAQQVPAPSIIIALQQDSVDHGRQPF
jgi:hypothetical protein